MTFICARNNFLISLFITFIGCISSYAATSSDIDNQLIWKTIFPKNITSEEPFTLTRKRQNIGHCAPQSIFNGIINSLLFVNSLSDSFEYEDYFNQYFKRPSLRDSSISRTTSDLGTHGYDAMIAYNEILVDLNIPYNIETIWLGVRGIQETYFGVNKNNGYSGLEEELKEAKNSAKENFQFIYNKIENSLNNQIPVLLNVIHGTKEITIKEKLVNNYSYLDATLGHAISILGISQYNIEENTFYILVDNPDFSFTTSQTFTSQSELISCDLLEIYKLQASLEEIAVDGEAKINFKIDLSPIKDNQFFRFSFGINRISSIIGDLY